MLSKVQDQYARDVARVHGEPVQRLDDEYRSFLAELGGAPPPEMMGLDASGAQGGGVGGQGQGQEGRGRGRGGGQGIVRSVLICVRGWGRGVVSAVVTLYKVHASLQLWLGGSQGQGLRCQQGASRADVGRLYIFV